MTTVPSYRLNDGHPLPAVGFGTYPLTGDAAAEAIGTALQAGYRLIDTAANYRNEEAVGRGLADSAVPRADLAVASKLPGRDHGYEETLDSFDRSRRRLGLDYLDQYLIHWPLPRQDKFVSSFQAMLHLREQGLIRSVGVSNFTEEHLRRLERETGTLPAVNQIELHPLFPQRRMRAVHQELGIVTECWSPLGKGRELLTNPEIVAIAQAHGVSAAQVVLRWHVQLGVVPIPKSGDPDRQRANLDVFGFALTEREMENVSGLERGRLFQDPEVHEEF